MKLKRIAKDDVKIITRKDQSLDHVYDLMVDKIIERIDEYGLLPNKKEGDDVHSIIILDKEGYMALLKFEMRESIREFINQSKTK